MQIDPDRYYDKQEQTYGFPNPSDCLVYAGTTGAMKARFPAKLANALMKTAEELGGAGMSYATAIAPRDETPRRISRKRHRDLGVDAEESESESENESVEDEEESE